MEKLNRIIPLFSNLPHFSFKVSINELNEREERQDVLDKTG